MVFRLIIRYFANNEQLVHRLSESYPMRKAARFVVHMFTKGKLIAEEKGLHDKLTAGELKKLVRRFSNNFRQELTKAKEEYQRKGK